MCVFVCSAGYLIADGDVSPSLEQQPDNVGLRPRHRDVQRRKALLRPQVHVNPVRKEYLAAAPPPSDPRAWKQNRQQGLPKRSVT